MKIYGQSLVSVIATVQKVPLELNVGYTLINEGDGSIAYRHDTDNTDTLAGASEAALRAVGGAIVKAGERAFIANGSPYVEVACITGATATLRLEPADMVGDDSESQVILDEIAKGGLADSVMPTFATVKNGTAARVEGASVGAVVFGVDVPYIKATITASRPVTGATNAPVANLGTIWVCREATNINGAFPLEPGQSMALPDNCNLEDFYLAVDTIDDGLAIIYTV